VDKESNLFRKSIHVTNKFIFVRIFSHEHIHKKNKK